MLLNHVGHDVHSRHYANDRASLVSAVQKIANWIVDQSKVAEAMENGSNVVPLKLAN